MKKNIIVPVLIVLIGSLTFSCSNFLSDSLIDPSLNRVWYSFFPSDPVASPSAQSNDLTGVSVALSGQRALVGASGVLTDSGAVYPYESIGGIWEKASPEVLRANDAQDGDNFGISVSLDGDFALIGANLDDGVAGDPTDNFGSVYMFKNNAGIWTQQDILRADEAQAGDNFGNSVSLDGDYAIIGACKEKGGSGDPNNGAGSAYIFKNNAGIWSQDAVLRASDKDNGDQFGISAAVSGDYALIGAWRYDGPSDSISNSGAVYVFHNTGGIWVEEDILIPDDLVAKDRFGGSIAMDGSLAVIGSEPGGVVKPGSAYVYRNNGGTWVQEAKLLPETSVPGEEDLFGGSVSISGRYAVIGAAKGDGLVPDSGTASVFFRNDDGSWIGTDTLQADDGQANDSFGLAVAVSGYTVLVGAPEEDGAGNLEPDAGKFYFFN